MPPLTNETRHLKEKRVYLNIPVMRTAPHAARDLTEWVPWTEYFGAHDAIGLNLRCSPQSLCQASYITKGKCETSTCTGWAFCI